MIKYSITESDIKVQARELSIFYLKPVHIVGTIALPLAIYLLVVGYVAAESEALEMGYLTLVLSALSLFCYVVWYLKFYKALLASFNENATNGKVEYEINKSDGNIEILRNSSDAFSFSIEEIEKISQTKRNMILRLQNKTLLIFPMQNDILGLIK